MLQFISFTALLEETTHKVTWLSNFTEVVVVPDRIL